MFKRLSHVNHVRVDTAYNSSIIQIGDSKEIHAIAHGLAVQREKPVFWGDEGDFKRFAIFRKPSPLPTYPDPLLMKKRNESGIIRVENMYVSGLSAAGILHIGSCEHMLLESRLKHIRHLIRHKKKRNKKLEE